MFPFCLFFSECFSLSSWYFRFNSYLFACTLLNIQLYLFLGFLHNLQNLKTDYIICFALDRAEALTLAVSRNVLNFCCFSESLLSDSGGSL